MTTVIYKCPNCGHPINDENGKNILTCQMCGSTITKEMNSYDKAIRYVIQKDILDRARIIKNREESLKSAIMLATVVMFFMVFGIVAHYLGI